MLGADAHTTPTDGGGDCLYCLVLADDVLFQALLQLGELFILLLPDLAGGDIGPKLDHVGQMFHFQSGHRLGLQLVLLGLQAQLLAADIGQTGIGLLGVGGHHDLFFLVQVGQLLGDGGLTGQGGVFQVDVGTGLVDEVDGLVRQIAVGNVPLTHGHRQTAHLRGDGHLVVGLIVGGDALNDLDALLDGGLLHNDGLEAALQGGVLLNVLAVLVEGSGANDLELAPGEGGFQNIGGIHAALGIAGAHNVVDLVDDQDDIAQLADLLNEALHAALKLAAELGARHQGSEVQKINLLVQQLVGHLTLGDFHGQTLGNGGLAHAGLADETGVILLTAVEDLDDALQLPVPADEFVQLALLGLLGQRDAVILQKFPLSGALPLGVGRGFLAAGSLSGSGGVAVAAKELVEEGEGGGAAVILAVAVPVGLGHQAFHTLGAAEGGHHLIGEVVKLLVGNAHLLHHVVDGLDAKLPGTLQAQTLIFGLSALQLGNKNNRYVFIAAAA